MQRRALELLPRWLAVVALLLVACGGRDRVDGSGREATEQRMVPPFTAVRVGGSLQVAASVGEPQAVTVAADDNIAPIVRTQVRDGVLVIDTAKRYRATVHAPRVIIVAPGLGSIEARDSATVTAADVGGAELRIRASGSARVDLAGLATEVLRVEAGGSAEVAGGGSVARLTIEASGSAQIELGELGTRAVDVQGSGSAAIEVDAPESIGGRLSGGATLRHGGAPRVTVATSGSAAITAR